MNENVKISNPVRNEFLNGANGVKKLLIFIAFIAGYLIMSLELLGFRLLAPYFGNSIYVWGTLIGLILAALAGGYYLGGWLADKKAALSLILKLYLAAGIFLLVDLFLYSPILKYLTDWGMIWGLLTATIFIFFVPMVALAAVSPIIMKILTTQEKTGHAAGLVYAWGTIGSLLGTFLTAFVLIPYFGSRLTLYSCFFLALVISAIIFLQSDWKKITWLGLFFLISLPSISPEKLPSDVILQTESVYNQIRLVDTEKMVLVILNSQRNKLNQSAYIKNGTLINFSYIDLFNIGPIITPVKNLLVLGMSGGASVRQHQQYSPDIKVDAVEIDPKVAAIAKERFGIREGDNLKIFEADARPFLEKSEKKYDMIEIDLFQGNPYLPFYVVSREFFQAAYSHLSSDGLLMMNIFAPRSQEILVPTLATINSVFPSVYTIPIDDNFVVLATRSTTSLEEIKNRIVQAKGQVSLDLRLAVDYTSDLIQEFQPDKKMPIFTDDWAPVELLTYRMLKGIRL